MTRDLAAIETYYDAAYCEYEDGIVDPEPVDPDACRETVGCTCTSCLAEMAADTAREPA